MSRFVHSLSVLIVAMSSLAAKAADEPPAASKAGLKEEVIRQWMEKHYTDMGKYATKKETLEFKSIRYAEPREGHPLSDGVPDNKKTTVYPIKLSIVHTTSWPAEGKSRKESIECMIVAFKDEFGDWTWRLKENAVEPLK